MSNIYIAGAKRTAIGGFQGGLSTLTAPELGGRAISSACAEANLEKSVIYHCIIIL